MRSNQNNPPKLHYQRHSRYQTATRSPQKRNVQNTHQFTPTRFNKKPTQRLSDIKNSINKCIQQISNKRQINRDALQQVHHVNKQITEFLSNNQSSGKSQNQNQEVTEISQYNPRSYIERQNINLTSFNTPYHRQSQQFEPFSSNLYQISQVNRIPFRQTITPSVQQGDAFLRNLLQNQRIQNQQLERQINNLRRQNERLLSTQNYYPNNIENQLLYENQRFRKQLNRLNNQGNLTSNSMIYEQFMKLKEENQKLRLQTIHLLKNKKY